MHDTIIRLHYLVLYLEVLCAIMIYDIYIHGYNVFLIFFKNGASKIHEAHALNYLPGVIGILYSLMLDT